MPKPTEPMTVVKLTVDSFKRLSAAHVTPSPTGLIEVRGRNRQGKSSLLESMIAALGGKKGAPELPIQEGQHGASVIVDLGDIVIKKHWKRDSGGKAIGSLVVEAKDGSNIASPQKVLDSLTGHFADPVAFLEMKPDEQVKTVLGTLGLDEALQELEAKAAGEFARRRDLGRDADLLSKAEQDMTAEISGLPAPAEAAGTLAELTEYLIQSQKWNAAIDTLEQRRATIEAQGKQAAADVEVARQRLSDIEEQRKRLTDDWMAATQALTNAGDKIDIEPTRVAIAGHEAATKWQGRIELLERKRAEAAHARDLHTESEKKLGDIRMDIGKLLSEAEFPIEDMAYDAERKLLTIGGIPFSQASQSEQLRAAAAIAMSGDPLIRVMFVREGSLLDQESEAELAAIAELNGWQLWFEKVDSNAGGAGVWIEDGVAYQAEDGAAQ